MSEADTIREGLVRPGAANYRPEVEAALQAVAALERRAEQAEQGLKHCREVSVPFARQNEADLRARAEQAERSAKGWEETAGIYAQNDADQRARAEQAEAERDALVGIIRKADMPRDGAAGRALLADLRLAATTPGECPSCGSNDPKVKLSDLAWTCTNDFHRATTPGELLPSYPSWWGEPQDHDGMHDGSPCRRCGARVLPAASTADLDRADHDGRTPEAVHEYENAEVPE